MVELAIILPTYNEAENLALLIEQLEGLGLDMHVLVVDDNSRDGTQEIAREMGERFGNVSLIARPEKLGLGSALKAGLIEALAINARYVMTMDADLSHDPKDMPRLLEAARRGNADLIQASRYISGGGVQGMSFFRRMTSRSVNFFYHLIAGAPQECTTNYRVLTSRAASLVVERCKGQHFELVPEMVFLVLAAGLKVEQVPIVFMPRHGGDSKLGIKQAAKGMASVLSNTLLYRLHLGRYRRRPFDDTLLGQ
jgi:dolichol-phosphate mannosyltransferase